jgi:CHRD domain
MKRSIPPLLVLFLALSMVGAAPALGAEGLSAQLNSYEETPSTLNSPGTGVFLGLIDSDETAINYQLFYTDLQGATVLFAHIHFGKPGESGGVVAFLCGGGGKPACPAPGTLITGTIVPANVQALAGQNLAAGDMAAFVRAIRNGFTYVNVHSNTFPAGELRGQIKSAAR